MESTVIRGGSRGVRELLASCCGLNRKAKKILGLLGFRSAAALPAHLHGAVLQLLLPGLEESLAPSAATDAGATACGRTWKPTSSFRSEGCAIQCLFSAWLTKTSKWLKAPRSRYVLLLAVRHENAPTQHQGLSASSGGAYGAIAAAGQAEANTPAKPSLPGAVRQQQDGQPSLQLLLVFFKVPALSFSEQGVPSSHFHELQGAEPSEAFTIDSSHKALCFRVQCGKGSQLVLIVEGLGGRLLVLGEPQTIGGSSSGGTSGQATGVTPLEELAGLINAAAPFCAPPKPSRWARLLQAFAVTAATDGLEVPLALQTLARSELRRVGKSLRGPGSVQDWLKLPASPRAHCRAAASHTSRAASEAEQRSSLLALLFRCSLAACYAVWRPFTFVLRLSSPSLLPELSEDLGDAAAVPDMSASACTKCEPVLYGASFVGGGKHGDYGTWDAQNGKGASSCAYLGANSGHFYQRCTLRQLIDDQQRAVAACAMRERCRKLALLKQEYQLLHQQASRSLTDERLQLFPQARRWVESTDGQLLLLCLTGHTWRRSSAVPRS